MPIALLAWVSYFDHDPVAFWDMTEQFEIAFSRGPNRYFGKSHDFGNRFELELNHQIDPAYWEAVLHVWSPFTSDEIHRYKNLPVDLQLPFDTGKFGDTNVSQIDFRQLQIME